MSDQDLSAPSNDPFSTGAAQPVDDVVEIAAMVQRAVGLSDWATGLGVGVMWAVLGCIIVGLLVAGEA